METSGVSISYLSSLKNVQASSKAQVSLLRSQSAQEAEVVSTLIESAAPSTPPTQGRLLAVA